MSVLPCDSCRGRLGKRGASEQSPAVIFVGMSPKPEGPALCESTATGKVISEIENKLGNCRIHRTNVVACPPVKDNGKWRYPTDPEMARCYPTLEAEIELYQPKVVVALGRKVIDFLLPHISPHSRSNQLCPNYNYEPLSASGFTLLPVHHPSFILIYRRRRMADYVSGVADAVARQLA